MMDLHTCKATTHFYNTQHFAAQRGSGSRLQVYMIPPPPPPISGICCPYITLDQNLHFRNMLPIYHTRLIKLSSLVQPTMVSNLLVQPAVTYLPTSNQSEDNSEITNQELVPETLDPTTGYKYHSLGMTSGSFLDRERCGRNIHVHFAQLNSVLQFFQRQRLRRNSVLCDSLVIQAHTQTMDVTRETFTAGTWYQVSLFLSFW